MTKTMKSAAEESPTPVQSSDSFKEVLFDDISVVRANWGFLFAAGVLEISYVLVNLLDSNVARFVWVAVVAISVAELWRRADHSIAKGALVSLIGLAVGVWCSIVESNLTVSSPIMVVVQVITLLLAIAYIFLQRDYLLYAQLCLLCCPFSYTTTPPLVFLLYLFASMVFLLLEQAVHHQISLPAMAMHMFPLVRMWVGFMLAYISIIVCVQTARLYSIPLSDSVTPPVTAADPPVQQPDVDDEELQKEPPPPPPVTVSKPAPTAPAGPRLTIITNGFAKPKLKPKPPLTIQTPILAHTVTEPISPGALLSAAYTAKINKN